MTCAPATSGQVKRKQQTWSRSEYTCSLCKLAQAPHRFDTVKLRRLENEDKLYLAECSQCNAKKAAAENAVETEPPVKCNWCGVLKPRSAFSDVKKRYRGDYKRWRCITCYFPACERCGEIAKDQQLMPYICELCKFPPCQCGTPRPQSSKYHVSKLPEWRCPTCRVQGQK